MAGHEIATTNFDALVLLSTAGLRRWWTSTRGRSNEMIGT
jgi:hypothetical protein